MKNGAFVISLDFELHWGVFDLMSTEQYEVNLTNTRKAIQGMNELCGQYDIKMTYATVGFLFAENLQELQSFSPENKPYYKNPKLNPYNNVNLGLDENLDPYHYARKILIEIRDNAQHEIGTHTFSHYYCLESGQDITTFESDLLSAIDIAKHNDIQLKSIVFPRNQVNPEYLEVCKKHGIGSYRGNERVKIYDYYGTTNKRPEFINRGLRLLDSYINLYGYHTYGLGDIQSKNDDGLVNIPSSRFLRPYTPLLRFLEPLKLRRIKKAMSIAAKRNQVFHLWWHPHNFGANLDKNLLNLESIFLHYKKLNGQYDFSNMTMGSLADQVKANPIKKNKTK